MRAQPVCFVQGNVWRMLRLLADLVWLGWGFGFRATSGLLLRAQPMCALPFSPHCHSRKLGQRVTRVLF